MRHEEEVVRIRSSYLLAIVPIALILGLIACTEETIKEVPVDRVVTQEVVKEVPVEKIVEVEKQVIQTVEVEKPVEVIKEVVREVQVPGQTVVVEKDVVVVREVKVPGETVVVEKDVVREVKVPGETVVVTKEVPVEVEKIVFKDPRAGGTLRVKGDSVKTLDPQTLAAPGNAGFHNAVSEGLFGRRWDMSAAAMLADKWEASTDGLTWKFTLRKGLTFQDGSPVTSADVIGSDERGKGGSGLWNRNRDEFFVSWNEIDSTTFELKLQKPAPWLIDAFGESSGVYPKSTWERDITDTTNDIIGTGPYMLEKWVSGDRITVTRWDGYQQDDDPFNFQVGKKVALVDKIEWLTIEESAAFVAALQAGQLDVITTLPAEFKAQLEKDKSIEVAHLLTPIFRLGIWPNHSKPPFDDVRVRRAVQMALDSEKMMLAGAGPASNWRLCASYWTCGSAWESDAGSEAYNVKDVEGGRKIIEDLGLTGSEVTIIVNEGNDILAGASRVTKEVLEDIGFKVNYDVMDNAAWRAARVEPDRWNVFNTYSTGLWHPFLGGTAHVSPDGWVHHYQDTTGKMQELFDRLLGEPNDAAGIKQITDEINALTYEDMPFISAGEFFLFQAYSKDVKGYVPSALLTFVGTWLER